MIKHIITLILIFAVSINIAHANSNEFEGIPNDGAISENISVQKHDSIIYSLFPTENMWTFIKLNTRNGKMWQVQYDIKGDNRFELFLNYEPLVSTEKEVNGRFTLYSTQNIYTFILLDQIEGKMWQVQWSIEPEGRVIFPIE